jgi:two-component system sensor histidine kinase PilS (NtrC family)
MYTNSAAELVLAEWKTKVGMKAPEEWIRYVSTALEEGMQDVEIKINDRILSMRLMPIEDAGYVNVYSRDITDQKQMAENLLTAERLAVVGRISAMMGHDLRGPLVVIRNAVDLARKKPARTDKVLDMIERSAGQAMDLLEELRTRTREDPVSLAPMEIGELLRKATENILLPDGVELRLEIDDTLPELVLDEAKTMRILDNVIRNAFDAMPAGGVLKIGATREGDKVVIRISDTGPGIPEDTLRNLFKPFYTTKPGGLGLGLTSTKQMVDVQGGTISVETSDGEGATFVIALPLKGKNPGQ